jgi:heme A synthase
VQPRRRFRALAIAAACAGWALVAVGGVVRVTASGLGCPHWPICTSRALPLDTRASAIEYSHRAVVALVVVLVVALAAGAWRSYRSRPDILWPATAAVVLVPFQALLGAVAVWLDLPGWVVAFHFVIGMLFLATIVAAAAASFRQTGAPASPGFARLAVSTVAVGLLLVSVGAAVVATDAATACGTHWPGCNGGFASGGGEAWLQVAHRMLAYTVAGLALALLVLARRGRGPWPAGVLPFVAVLAQVSFGIGIVLSGGTGRADEVLSGLHVAGAGAVWALLVALAVLCRPPRVDETAEQAVLVPARAG